MWTFAKIENIKIFTHKYTTFFILLFKFISNRNLGDERAYAENTRPVAPLHRVEAHSEFRNSKRINRVRFIDIDNTIKIC